MLFVSGYIGKLYKISTGDVLQSINEAQTQDIQMINNKLFLVVGSLFYVSKLEI